jgi:hypothetical protein
LLCTLRSICSTCCCGCCCCCRRSRRPRRLCCSSSCALVWWFSAPCGARMSRWSRSAVAAVVAAVTSPCAPPWCCCCCWAYMAQRFRRLSRQLWSSWLPRRPGGTMYGVWRLSAVSARSVYVGFFSSYLYGSGSLGRSRHGARGVHARSLSACRVYRLCISSCIEDRGGLGRPSRGRNLRARLGIETRVETRPIGFREVVRRCSECPWAACPWDV